MINKKTRQSKYNNKTVVINDISFDSYMESRYYLYLIELQKHGVVKDIQLQVPFVIQDAFVMDGKKHQAITYVADFVVTYSDGREEIVDVKGKVTQTFRNKRKMFIARYKRDIKCVQRKKREWVELKFR